MEPIRSEVYDLIQAECRRFKVDVLAIGGIEDHVHLLARMPATVAPAVLVQRAKGASAHAVNHAAGIHRIFKWQGSYGAFSVSKRHVPLISNYVLRQEEHHREQRIWQLLEPPPRGAGSEEEPE